MNRQNQDIDKLFKKYLKGTCKASELDELLDHFKISDKRQLSIYIRNQLESTVSAQIDQNKVSSITASAHINLMREIKTNQVYRPVKLWRWVAVAVMALFAIGTTIYKYNLSLNEDIVLTSQFGNDVLPGGNRAHITFSNGEKLNLDTTQTGLIYKNGKYSYANGEELKVSRADYATVSTPAGGMYQLTLPDGSKAWLNSLSSIKYPSIFAADKRSIEVSGEVYLEIAADKSKPFVVHTRKQRIEVLGTAFNIREYERRTVTTLTHGKIKLADVDNQHSLVLTTGEQAILSGGEVSKTTVEASDYAAWKDGIILQRNASLVETCIELERWYDVKFKFAANYNNYGRAFHSINRNEMLSSVLLALKHTYKVNFEIKGKEVLVK
ncbi:FecR family protein [Sphingobacterium nematocida]|uniref:FecR family protein n=1 Tax=Sphingobacterium nematocida TaxID=1513896 RepID=A0A1T5ATL2_9SPHI|nr:FecR family protein [Sphingobacterium nematocida]SKB38255.1 FecR family protein [Sphingobacterium nematocida]